MAAPKLKQGMPLGHAPHAVPAVLILLCVLGFGTLLVGCTPGGRGGDDALDSARSAQAERSTTRSAQETTARLADEASKAKPPPNVAEAAAAGLIASGLGALRLVVRRDAS